MSSSGKTPPSGGSAFSDTELWTGAVLTAFGAGAAWLATGFDATSRPFPLTVALLLSVCGLAIFLRALFSRKHQALPFHDFGIVALGALLIVGWALALKAGAGFLIATTVFLFGIFWLAGLRQTGRVIILSVLIALTNYAIFALLLNVRLPASFLSFIAPGF
ncbi:tripartite tricarboxylate transporter TctB family protein [Martelella soudanensis]|uniref:tripartite tricarboxylate transporter TctB family protein n=1 Tax=unclassified Martelella TaxID=2629616 RepID=UPI0015DED78A|nr:MULTISPECIES: tripartite tricarboxylate transporter TctB family protein [unclassified Martelella]